MVDSNRRVQKDQEPAGEELVGFVRDVGFEVPDDMTYGQFKEIEPIVKDYQAKEQKIASEEQALRDEQVRRRTGMRREEKTPPTRNLSFSEPVDNREISREMLRGERGVVSRGLEAGTRQIAASVPAITSLGQGAAGFEDAAVESAEAAGEQLERAATIAPQTSFRDVVEGEGSFGVWAAGMAAQQAPVLATFLASGGVGGALAKGGQKAALQGLKTSLAAQQRTAGIARNVAASEAQRETRRRAFGTLASREAAVRGGQRQATQQGRQQAQQRVAAQGRRVERIMERKQATEELIRRTAEGTVRRQAFGQAAGAAGAGVPLHATDTSQWLIDPEATGSVQQRALAGFGTATIAALSEIAPTLGILRNIGWGQTASHLTKRSLQNHSAVRRIATGAAKQATLEASAEVGSEVIKDASYSFLNENFDMLSTDNMWKYFEAAAAGGLIGGGLGGATSVRGRDFAALGRSVFQVREPGATEDALQGRYAEREMGRARKRSENENRRLMEEYGLEFEDLGDTPRAQQMALGEFRADIATSKAVGTLVTNGAGIETDPTEAGQMIRIIIDPDAQSISQLAMRTEEGTSASAADIARRRLERMLGSPEAVQTVLDASIQKLASIESARVEGDRALLREGRVFNVEQDAYVELNEADRQRIQGRLNERQERLSTLMEQLEEIGYDDTNAPIGDLGAEFQRARAERAQAEQREETFDAEGTDQEVESGFGGVDEVATSISFPLAGEGRSAQGPSGKGTQSATLGRIFKRGERARGPATSARKQAEAIFQQRLDARRRELRERGDTQALERFDAQAKELQRLQGEVLQARRDLEGQALDARVNKLQSEMANLTDLPTNPVQTMPAGDALAQTIQEQGLDENLLVREANAAGGEVSTTEQAREFLNQYDTVVDISPPDAVTGEGRTRLTEADIDTAIEEEQPTSRQQVRVTAPDGQQRNVNLVTLTQRMVGRSDLAATSGGREARQQAGARQQAEGTSGQGIAVSNVGRAAADAISSLQEAGYQIESLPSTAVVFRTQGRDITLGEAAATSQGRRLRALVEQQGGVADAQARLARVDELLAEAQGPRQAERRQNLQKQRREAQKALRDARRTERLAEKARRDKDLEEEAKERKDRINRRRNLIRKAKQDAEAFEKAFEKYEEALLNMLGKRGKKLTREQHVQLLTKQINERFNRVPEGRRGGKFYAEVIPLLKARDILRKARPGKNALAKARHARQQQRARAETAELLLRLEEERYSAERARSANPLGKLMEEFLEKNERGLYDFSTPETGSDPFRVFDEEQATPEDTSGIVDRLNERLDEIEAIAISSTEVGEFFATGTGRVAELLADLGTEITALERLIDRLDDSVVSKKEQQKAKKRLREINKSIGENLERRARESNRAERATAAKRKLDSLVNEGKATRKDGVYYVTDAGATKYVAGTTPGDLVYVNIAKARETGLAEYIQNSDQKLAVLDRLGVSAEQFASLFSNRKEVNAFLRDHELSHVKNRDQGSYPRKSDGSLDLMHPDAIAIETRATIDGLNARQKKKLKKLQTSGATSQEAVKPYKVGDYYALDNLPRSPLVRVSAVREFGDSTVIFHRNPNNKNSWQATEVRTGKRVSPPGDADTMKESIASTMKRLKEVGVEEFNRAIGGQPTPDTTAKQRREAADTLLDAAKRNEPDAQQRQQETEFAQSIVDGLKLKDVEVEVVSWAEMAEREPGINLDEHDGFASHDFNAKTGEIKTKIWINEKTVANGTERAGVLHHELGHVVTDAMTHRVTEADAKKIWAAYAKWAKANNIGTTTLAKLAKTKRSLLNTVKYREGARTMLKDLSRAEREHVLSFHEWMADQVGRWIETDSRPRSRMERYFKAIADRLKALTAKFTGRGLPDTAVRDALNRLWDSRRPNAAVRHFNMWNRLAGKSGVLDGKYNRQMEDKVFRVVRRQAANDAGIPPERMVVSAENARVHPYSIEGFFGVRDIVIAKLTSEERRLLGRAFMQPKTRRKMYNLLKRMGHDADGILDDQFSTVAVGYLLWRAGALDLSPGGSRAFNGIAKFILDVTGTLSEVDQAKQIMNAIQADTITARESELHKNARKGSLLARGAYTLEAYELSRIREMIDIHGWGTQTDQDKITTVLNKDRVLGARQISPARRKAIARDIKNNVFTQKFVEKHEKMSDYVLNPDKVFAVNRVVGDAPLQQNARAVMNTMDGMQRWVRSSIGKLVLSEAMRARWAKNPGLRRFSESLVTDVLQEGGREGFLNLKERQRGQWDTRFNRIVENLNDDEQAQLRDLIFKRIDKAPPKVMKARAEYNRLMRQLYNYARTAGLPMGDAGQNYFPWVFDPMTVEKKSKELFRAWSDPRYREHWEALAARHEDARVNDEGKFPDDGVYADYVRGWINAIMTQNNGLADAALPDQGKLDPAPHVGAMNTRELDFLDDPVLAPDEDRKLLASLFNDDLGTTMAVYIDQLVKRVEYSRAFGHKGERFRQMVAQAKQMGASENDVDLMHKMLHSAMGTIGLEVAPFWKKVAEPINKMAPRIVAEDGRPFPTREAANKKMGELKTGGKVVEHNGGFAVQRDLTGDPKKFRDLFGWLVTYQNLRILAFAALTNLADVAGVAFRTGDFRMAGHAYAEGLRNLRRHITDRKLPKAERAARRSSMERLAEEMGIITQASVSDVLGQFYGGNQFSGSAKKWNDRLFRWNGMEYLTRTTRVMATAAGTEFLAYHGQRAQAGDAASADKLLELGLDPADLRFDADGRLKLLSLGEIDAALEGTSYTTGTDVRSAQAAGAQLSAQAVDVARDDRVRQALYRMVDESVLRPTATQRPSWMNDPNWQLFSHLKGFMYTYHERVLRRAYGRAAQGNYAPLLLMSTYVAAIMAADYLREWIQHGPQGDPMKARWGLKERIVDGIHRSGTPGMFVLPMDMMKTHEYGRSQIAQLGGPTTSQIEQWYRAVFSNGQLSTAVKRSVPASQVLDSVQNYGEYAFGRTEDDGAMFDVPLINPWARDQILEK